MCESSNATPRTLGSLDSHLSFYEYPQNKLSYNLSGRDGESESNRDELLVSLQSLSLKIKNLENKRKEAESNFRDTADELIRSSRNHRDPQTDINEENRTVTENFHRSQISPKRRTSRKNKRNHCSSSAPTIINIQGKHYYSDINERPFILGQSTSQSHNVKSNLQHVGALLKNHHHHHHPHLCLSSKTYADLLHSRRRSELSPHILLYLDHYNKPSHRHSQTVSTTGSHCHSCLKRSEPGSSDIESLSQRMETISEELEHLQRQFMISSHDHLEQGLDDISFETLGSTKLLQLILKDSINDYQ